MLTGGSSGIGLALAEIMIKDHYSVVIIARDEEKLEVAKRSLLSIAPEGSSVMAIAADVTDEAQVIRAINKTLDTFGRIDWLVCSAGASYPGYFEDQTDTVFRKTFEVNFFGIVNTVRHVLPGMKHRRQGNIVLISSGAAIFGIFGSASYSSSKFALSGFAEVLRSECKPFGIVVSLALPPDTDTPMYQRNKDLKPPETQVLMASAGTHSAQKVARSIYRGAQVGLFAISTGFRLNFLQRMKSLIYPLIFKWGDNKIRQEMERRHAEHHNDHPHHH